MALTVWPEAGACVPGGQMPHGVTRPVSGAAVPTAQGKHDSCAGLCEGVRQMARSCKDIRDIVASRGTDLAAGAAQDRSTATRGTRRAS